MENANTCPHCNREIPPESAGGECPYCRGKELASKAENDTVQKRSLAEDQNLLFGILAIQLRLIGAEQFIKAAAAWSTDPSIRIGQRLIDDGILSEADYKLVDQLIDRAIEDHGRDLGATLAEASDDDWMADATVRKVHDGFGVPLGDQTDVLSETPGRYTQSSEYSRGGMGRILLVHDQFLSRDVAMKELLPRSDSQDMEIDGESPVRAVSQVAVRFLREAKITGRLEHPSIVPVYEMGRRSNGTLYYTMKLVRGRTLGKSLQQTKSLAERLSYLSHFLDLCQALAYAHQRDVVHRDIKPSNIMIGDFGETVVIDWGLAKVLGHVTDDEQELAKTWTQMHDGPAPDSAQTIDGVRLGTPQYMAPEQAEGRVRDIDRRTDVFALGVVLYQILTGERPFHGNTKEEIFDQITNLKFVPVQQLAPGVPPELVSICSRAMQKRRDDRYQSAKEVADDIQRFLTGSIVQAYNYSPTELLGNLYRRHRAIVNTVAAATALLLVLATISYVNVYRSRNEAIAAQGRETIAKDAQSEARQRAEATNYINQIRLAQSLIAESNYPRARDVLWATEPSRRQWEWGALIAKAHPERYSLNGYQGFAVSPDGRFLSRAHRAKPIQIHDPRDGQLQRELPVDQDSVILRQMFSPDSSLLVAVTSKRTMRIWDTETWQILAPPASHDGIVKDALFLPDSRLLTFEREAPLQIWDLRSGLLTQSIATGEQPIDRVQASSDGRRIMTVSNVGDLLIWNVASGEQIGSIEESELIEPEETVLGTPRHRILSPSGQQVALDIGDKVRLWNIDDPDTSLTLSGHHSQIVSMEFDSTGGRILVTGNEGTAIVWDTVNGSRLHVIAVNGRLLKSIWSPDDSLVCTHPLAGVPQIWNVRSPSLQLVNRLGEHRLITPYIGFLPSSDQIITADGAGMMKVWSARGNSYQSIVGSASEPIVQVTASADSSRIAVTAGKHSMVVIDRLQNRALVDFVIPSAPQVRTPHAVISPDGSLCASTLDPFVPTIIGIDSETIETRYFGHTSHINAVAFSPDGSQVMTAAWDGSLHAWDPRTGNQQIVIQHDRELVELAIREEAEVAAADADGNVMLYDMQSGKLSHQLLGLESRITALRWSPDGTMLAAGFADGNVAMWKDIGTAQALKATLLGKHISRVRTIEFASSGRLLSFSRSDSRVWSIPSGTEVFSTNDGADHVVRVSSDGELLSCNRGLLFHWDSVGEILRDGRAGGTTGQQPRRFDQIRRQRLAKTPARYPVESGKRQLVIATPEVVQAGLTQIAKAVEDQVIDDTAPNERAANDDLGLRVSSGPMAQAAGRLGLRRDDRITRIAARPVTDTETASAAIQAATSFLRDDVTQIEIDVVRQSQRKPLSILLLPQRESTVSVQLERSEAIDTLNRINQGYRQSNVDQQQREQPAFISDVPTPTDRQRILGAELSLSDQIIGFNEQKIENYGQLLETLDQFLPLLKSMQTSEFSLDVQRGVVQVIHFHYQIE